MSRKIDDTGFIGKPDKASQGQGVARGFDSNRYLLRTVSS